MSPKKLPALLREGDYCRAQIWGLLLISAALKIPKTTVSFIILKWKIFATTKTLPRVGRPTKLSNRETDAHICGPTDKIPVQRGPHIYILLA